MKKYFYFVMVAFLSTMSLTFVSCSSDDDDETLPSSGKTININGVDYEIDPYMTLEGYLDSSTHKGEFTVSYFTKEGDTRTAYYLTFEYSSPTQPQVGDDFAQKSLGLSVMFSHFSDSYDVLNGENPWAIIPYKSGSAKVVGVEKNKIIVQFNNLQMKDNKMTYTFNGTVDIDYNFAKTSAD